MSDDRFRYEHPHFGLEFDWLAHDCDGFIGFMMSAGYGPVPQAVYEHFIKLDDELDPAITKLPIIGGFRLEKHPPITTPYESPAERGLYCYDWVHWNGPYQRASIPNRPLTLQDLPSELSKFAVLVQLPVTLATCREIELTDLGIKIALQHDLFDGS